MSNQEDVKGPRRKIKDLESSIQSKVQTAFDTNTVRSKSCQLSAAICASTPQRHTGLQDSLALCSGRRVPSYRGAPSKSLLSIVCPSEVCPIEYFLRGALQQSASFQMSPRRVHANSVPPSWFPPPKQSVRF